MRTATITGVDTCTCQCMIRVEVVCVCVSVCVTLFTTDDPKVSSFPERRVAVPEYHYFITVTRFRKIRERRKMRKRYRSRLCYIIIGNGKNSTEWTLAQTGNYKLSVEITMIDDRAVRVKRTQPKKKYREPIFKQNSLDL